MKTKYTTIALVGGGPAALFMYKQFLHERSDIHVTIFEKSCRLGAGMPYSAFGAEAEHVTNVSANEIPELPQTPKQWLDSQEGLEDIRTQYSPYKVLPRRIFGDYLEAQFHNLLNEGRRQGMVTKVYLDTEVTDINYVHDKVIVSIENSKSFVFDKIIICTGHRFPKESSTEHGIFTSPYPPKKLSIPLNHPVALRGASLTAVDAIKSLARANGEFSIKNSGKLSYRTKPECPDFKIVMHCRNGMLPAVRFHLADSHLKNPSILTKTEIEKHKKANNGFLSLDFIFEKDFLEPLQKSDADFYSRVRGMKMEEFVAAMLELRHSVEPFTLLKSECNEAKKSIMRRESIYWKELLGVLSFAMNYPAKYFSAEDMLRFKATLHPLISLVIAYIPQSSCRELLALHKAGCLELVNVGGDSVIEAHSHEGITYHYSDSGGKRISMHYKTYVDCTGQPHIDFSEFPFKGLVAGGIVSQARLAFRNTAAAIAHIESYPEEVDRDKNGNFFLKVSGVAISDCFQVVDGSGNASDSVFIMAVPYMGGYNPDYSGLDFCDEASKRIANNIFRGIARPVSKTTSGQHVKHKVLGSVA